MLKLRIIKSKEFTANDKKQTHYTVAYKGRVFGLSTLAWSDDMDSIAVKDNTLSIDGQAEIKKREVTDPLTGEMATFYDIMPKLDIALAI